MVRKNGFIKGATPMIWDDMKKLVRWLEKDGDHRFALLIALGCTTGFRISDLLTLRWVDLLDQEGVSVEEQKTRKERYMPLAAETQRMIENVYKTLEYADINELVFTGKRAKGAFSIQYVNRKLKMIKSTYPFRMRGQFSTHSLRKTFGKRYFDLASDKGRALIKLSKLLNHSSPEVTREYIGLEAREFEIDIANMW